jgi:SH3-like domain-containing protein
MKIYKEWFLKKIVIMMMLLMAASGMMTIVSANDLNNIRATLYAWKDAWESKDINRYRLFYSKDFNAQGLKFQEWMKRKAILFKKPGAVQIDMSDIEIGIEEDRIIIRFMQRYQSPTILDAGFKELVFTKTEGMYQIVSEIFSALPLQTQSTPGKDQQIAGALPAATQKKELLSKPTPDIPFTEVVIKGESSPVKRQTATGIKLGGLHLAATWSSDLAFEDKGRPILSVVGRSGDWRRVRTKNGAEKWIHFRFLTETALPIIETPQEKTQQSIAVQAEPAAAPPAVRPSETEAVKQIEPPLVSLDLDGDKQIVSQADLGYVYGAPDFKAKILFRLIKGRTYPFIKRKGSWYQIRLEDGRTGWAHETLFNEPPQASQSAQVLKEQPVETKISRNTAPASKDDAKNQPETPTHTSKEVYTPLSVVPGNEVQAKVSLVRVYDTPGTDGTIIFWLEKGKVYPLLGSQNDWLHIKIDDERTGWVQRRAFSIGDESGKEISSTMTDAKMEEQNIESQEPQTRADDGKWLTSNVVLGGAYERPALDAKIKFRLEKGKKYAYLKKRENWYLIELEDGRTGWAHQSLFRKAKKKEVLTAKKNREISTIRYDITTEGEERVYFELNDFFSPQIFLAEDDESKLVCDFLNVGAKPDLPPYIKGTGKIIRKIRSEVFSDSIRVIIDLNIDSNYDVQQLFFKKENLFILSFKESG